MHIYIIRIYTYVYISFHVTALQPSLIRGLRVCIQALNGTYAAIEAAWYPPSRPQGMVTAYEFQVKAGLQDLILANEELMTNEVCPQLNRLAAVTI